ncbi:uncharacterized protein LOC130653610 isoform X2 [Hydractinia symbiolongicarpus]|uniref:uncharacterized protein LOC130653610 isoform X2 n=1 Tax=Hydractinia symbiolongicarpus TaxID=13093 RepID=UPI00254AC56D|nr:uncharacterized protein LOC130653610 isoform X2 [Hydractinia symbiolongicarpus]
MEREHLLPKGPQLDSKRENEHYQKREQRALQQPTVRDYDPLPTDPPLITQNYGAAEHFHSSTININGEDLKELPNEYAGPAWLSVLFCCFPLAALAIHESNQVKISIERNEIDKAHIHSIAAKKFSSLAVVFGILFLICGMILLAKFA